MGTRLAPRIRPAAPDDLDALLGLELEAFATDRLDRRALRHAIASPTIVALVADAEGAPVAGYALVQLRRGSTVARLTSLAVASAASGRGIGRALLAAAEQAARQRGNLTFRLEVRADNRNAVALYERAGFGRGSVQADYYEDGAAALRYEKRIA